MVALEVLVRHHSGGARGACEALWYCEGGDGGDVMEVHGVMLMKFDGCSLVA